MSINIKIVKTFWLIGNQRIFNSIILGETRIALEAIQKLTV